MTQAFSIDNHAEMFQVVSRDNDRNGNPYRLVLVYDDTACVVQMFEARSSSPNIVLLLRRMDLLELVEFKVSPAVYRQVRNSYTGVEVISTY